MTKVKVGSIILADRLFIDKTEVEDKDSLLAAYTYQNGKDLLTTISEDNEYYIVPSNSYHKLDYDASKVQDERTFEELPYKLEFAGSLREEQQDAVDKMTLRGRARSGILQAPCGWGKTFSGCSIVAATNVRTLILVHTNLLFSQWISEIESLIPNVKVGKIGAGHYDVQDVTVAIYKTVVNNLDDLCDKFSMVIVDEAHMCPADMFSTTLNNINAKIKIGITATPRRKDGKHIFLADYFTPYLVKAIDSRKLAVPFVKIIRTDFKFNVHDPKRDWTKAVTKLAQDTSYQEFLAKLINKDINKEGRCPLILADRVQFLEELQTMIPNSICIIGKTENREELLEQVGPVYKAVLSTKIFDEGVSCHRLDTLYQCTPHNNLIKLEQRIGRIEREHPDAKRPKIVDPWLSGLIVSRQQNNRLQWYIQRGYDIL